MEKGVRKRSVTSLQWHKVEHTFLQSSKKRILKEQQETHSYRAARPFPLDLLAWFVLASSMGISNTLADTHF